MLCSDSGLTFGTDQPWRWCTCAAGIARREKEPNLVDEANATREALLCKFPKKYIKPKSRRPSVLFDT
jgi:hypothetical protein